MKTQISRVTHDPANRYSGVYQQQGRLITDADWNELVDLVRERLEGVLRDVVGSGAPMANKVRVRPDLTFATGPLYADGVPAVLPPQSTGYGAQIDFPSAPGAPQANEVLYADVWHRSVLHLEQPSLRDPGLHGADTCTRLQTMVQVKRAGAGVSLDGAANPPLGTARATVSLRQATGVADPCDPCASTIAVGQSAGNWLFRLEVHDVVGTANAPTAVTLKWSVENGAEVYRTSAVPPFFKTGSFVYEFFSDASEKELGVHNVSAAGFPTRLPLRESFPAAAPAGASYVRRWDGYCRITKSNAGWALAAGVDAGAQLGTALGQGVHGHVDFQGGALHLRLLSLDVTLTLDAQSAVAGDYWLATARESNQPGDVLLSAAPPAGIRHHYVRLGKIVAAQGGLQFQADPPLEFPPLSAFKATAGGAAGASLVGAAPVPGNPDALTGTTVAAQLSELLGFLNAHLNAIASAHPASAIDAAPDANAAGTTVQSQLTDQIAKLKKLADDLASQQPGAGATLVGDAAVGTVTATTPKTLAAGTVRAQLADLLGLVNTLYTQPVGNADKLDGYDASAFAFAGHDHDTRYPRSIFADYKDLNAGQVVLWTRLSDAPDAVLFSYLRSTISDVTDPDYARVYVNGPLTPQIKVSFKKVVISVWPSDKDYDVYVTNGSAEKLTIYLKIFRVGT